METYHPIPTTGHPRHLGIGMGTWPPSLPLWAQVISQPLRHEIAEIFTALQQDLQGPSPRPAPFLGIMCGPGPSPTPQYRLEARLAATWH
jgi:hypothetical protein